MMLHEPLEEQPLIFSDCVKKVSHGFETIGCASPHQIFSALCHSLRGAILGENLVGAWNCNFPATEVGLTAELGAALSGSLRPGSAFYFCKEDRAGFQGFKEYRRIKIIVRDKSPSS